MLATKSMVSPEQFDVDGMLCLQSEEIDERSLFMDILLVSLLPWILGLADIFFESLSETNFSQRRFVDGKNPSQFGREALGNPRIDRMARYTPYWMSTRSRDLGKFVDYHRLRRCSGQVPDRHIGFLHFYLN